MGILKVFKGKSSSRCKNLGCGPRLSSEPRVGEGHSVGDIVCIHQSVYDPFYRLIGGDVNSAGKGKPGCRPCIIIETRKEAGNFVVCLMATFDKSAFEKLPDIFRAFVVLVPTTNPSDKALDAQYKGIGHIHTTPEWELQPANSGGLQFIITIPIAVTLGYIQRWGTPDMPPKAGFFLDPDYAMKRLEEKISEHTRYWEDFTAENRQVKLPALLSHLKQHEKNYKSSLPTVPGHRKRDAASRMSGRPGSCLSAGFTLEAEGGTEDVDGYRIIGPNGKPRKAKSRKSFAPSSIAPTLASRLALRQPPPGQVRY